MPRSPLNQGRLFPTEKLKGQAKKLRQISEDRFRALLKKGYDPAWFMDVGPHDRPTLAEGWKKAGGTIGQNGKDVPFYTSFRMVVLSRGPEDQDRRVVARSSSKSWMDGLWIGLLRRQVKEGEDDVKVWAYDALLFLERDPRWTHVVAEWNRTLVMKERI